MKEGRGNTSNISSACTFARVKYSRKEEKEGRILGKKGKEEKAGRTRGRKEGKGGRILRNERRKGGKDEKEEKEER